MSDQPTLDCQTCGVVVYELSPAEAQQVARNPENFIVYCREHAPIRMRLQDMWDAVRDPFNFRFEPEVSTRGE